MRQIPDIEALLREYNGYLRLQRGLSANTAEAYRRDVEKLTAWLAAEHTPLREVTYPALEQFTAALFELGIAETTRKRIVSGIKSFFHFLRISDFIAEDPSLLLETPRPGLHLPEVLTLSEIDALIAAIDPDSAEADRNRAIMETLYGCGLRVSELTNLEIGRINFAEGFITVLGKGSKERIVPMSPGGENQARRGGNTLSQPPRPPAHTPDDLHHRAPPRRGRRSDQNHLAPHHAPQFCHPSARRGRQSALHPADAGP